MRVVVGLRNPGSDYDGTRHNVGFEVLETAVERDKEHLGRAPLRIRGLVAQTGGGENRTLYLVPATSMNESGGPIRAALGYHKAAPMNLLVIHDDIDLAFGRLRIQVAGGSGGHNALVFPVVAARYSVQQQRFCCDSNNDIYLWLSGVYLRHVV